MRERCDNLRTVVGRKRPGGLAFTLIELLVVVLVLLLIMAMVLPALGRAAMIVNRNKSQTIINQLDQAVRLYQQDFTTTPSTPGNDPNGLPPSSYTDPSGNLWYGSQALVYFLTGYHNDANGNIAYGLKPNRNSPSYGPYYDAEKLKTSSSTGGMIETTASSMNNDTDIWAIKDPNGNARPTFLDGFGKPITYYKATLSGGTCTYNLADNSCSDSRHGAWGYGVYFALYPDVQRHVHVHGRLGAPIRARAGW